MKTCTKCVESKEESEFAWKKKDVKRNSWCKACQNVAAKNHYNDNKQYYKDKSNRNRRSYIPRGKQFIIDYLLAHPCVDCGEEDIEVLQFDHVVELDDWKAPRVTSLLGYNVKKIEEEISKCQVRCANCHVRRTRRRAGTLRVQAPVVE